MSEFMSHDRFVQYFPMLVLDQRALPKKREAILTLLVSIMIDIDVGKPYTEWRLNAKLRAWVEKYGELIGLDHVWLM